MGEARRLVTAIEVDAPAGPTTDREMSVSARHELELIGGERVTLLSDRGWTTSGPGDLWSSTTLQQLTDTARTVVGPDEPPPGRSHAEEAASHWAHLALVAREQGVHVTAEELASLPHDVQIGPGIRARTTA